MGHFGEVVLASEWTTYREELLPIDLTTAEIRPSSGTTPL